MFERTVSYDGDIIKTVQIKKGGENRPLWDTLIRLPINDAIGWVDRYDGLSPISAEWALALAYEEATETQVPRIFQQTRTLHAEINRLIWLTTYLGQVTNVLKLNSLREEVLLLREQTLSMTEELLGARILPHAFNLGGVERLLSLGELQKIRTFVKSWRFQWERWLDFFNDPIIESRLKGLLVLHKNFVQEKGLWGVVGKASGLSYDARKLRPYGAYPSIQFEIPVETGGDALARVRVVQKEIGLALKLIESVGAEFNLSQTTLTADIGKIRNGFFKGSVESSKGPLTALILVEGNAPQAIRIFSTAQRVWPWIEELLVGLRADDLELALVSLGVDPQEAEV